MNEYNVVPLSLQILEISIYYKCH